MVRFSSALTAAAAAAACCSTASAMTREEALALDSLKDYIATKAEGSDSRCPAAADLLALYPLVECVGVLPGAEDADLKDAITCLEPKFCRPDPDGVMPELKTKFGQCESNLDEVLPAVGGALLGGKSCAEVLEDALGTGADVLCYVPLSLLATSLCAVTPVMAKLPDTFELSDRLLVCTAFSATAAGSVEHAALEGDVETLYNCTGISGEVALAEAALKASIADSSTLSPTTAAEKSDIDFSLYLEGGPLDLDDGKKEQELVIAVLKIVEESVGPENGVTEEDVKRVLESADTNKDGELTKEELEAVKGELAPGALIGDGTNGAGCAGAAAFASSATLASAVVALFR